MTVHSNTEPAAVVLDRTNERTGRLLVRWNIAQASVSDGMSGKTRQEWQYDEESIVVTADSTDDIDLARAARNVLLSRVDCLCLRYTDQLALVAAGVLPATTMTAAQYQALLIYRQALRDITKTFTSLTALSWPEAPEGIAS
jgi:hypothetical protein